jgi:hypothetical protein
MIATVLMLLVAPPQSVYETAPGWASIYIAPALAYTETTITFGTLPRRSETEPLTFWARRDHKSLNGSKEMTWTTSVACPRLVGVIKDLGEMEPVKPRVRMLPESSAIMVLDGVQYRLKAESSFGDYSGTHLTIETNTGTPLATWAEATQTALARCWGPTPPSA